MLPCHPFQFLFICYLFPVPAYGHNMYFCQIVKDTLIINNDY